MGKTLETRVDKLEAKRVAFIAALRTSGNVRAACLAAGIARKTAYRWRDTWATFADDWAEALEDSCDVLEAEARRRGLIALGRVGDTYPVKENCLNGNWPTWAGGDRFVVEIMPQQKNLAHLGGG